MAQRLNGVVLRLPRRFVHIDVSSDLDWVSAAAQNRRVELLGNCYEERPRLDDLRYRFSEAFLGEALMGVLRLRGAGFVSQLPSPDGSIAMSCHRASVDRFVHLRG